MAEFDGRSVLITGGGSGIGFATARQLVDAGANVVLAGRRKDRINAAAKDLDPTGDRVLAVATDVSSVADLDELVSAIRDRYGRLDGVFANAGTSFSALNSQVREQDFDEVVGVNFKGVYFTIQKAVSLFDGDGAVVVNGTCLTHRGLIFSSVYAATKGAVSTMVRSLAAELAGRGIRVNSVSPGFIETDMLDEIAPNEQARTMVRGLSPLGRFGRPEDVANAVTFLLSSRAGYITGQDLGVDGGLASSVVLSGPGPE
jgi:NAD(P)-dependent dehydrogenase (short-subunit alcohol dehydrogenase family)